MEPPAALRAAIARELEGRSRAGLADRTAATTAHYRAGRTSAAAIRDADDALAYALARLPATYAAAASVLGEAVDRAPDFAPRSLLDAGSGPGGGGWAAQDTWPSLEHVIWLDASAPFLELAKRLAADSPLASADVRRGDLNAADLPRADVVLASYALAEIAEADLVPLARRLWAACDGMLVLVEPGTPAGHARLLAVREALAADGAAILAPCPRARPGVGAPAAARVLARPRAGKPGIDLKLCTPAGLEARFVARRDKAAHAVARRLDWCDSLEPAGEA